MPDRRSDERVRLAHAWPTIAIAANSPMRRPPTPAGVGPDARVAGRQWRPPRHRLRGALKAPVMRSPDTQDTCAVTDYVPFADWADGRVPLDGRRQ